MMKDMFPAFTKDLMEGRNKCRYFYIYYRYDDMKKCVPLVVDVEKRINLDPAARIKNIPGEPVRMRFMDLRHWHRLLDDFIANDPSLKIMVVEVDEFSDEKVVMAVGKNGHWNIRAQYMHALNRIIVGCVRENMHFAYAS